MINAKKGTAHSLAQSDFVGTVTVDPITRVVTPTVVAGQIVRKTSAGAILKGLATTADQVGFAVNNTDEGDVKESGKLGAYALDGGSVIETDQVAVTINTTNFPSGGPVYAIVNAGDSTDGKVTNASSGNKLVGTVDGIRTIYSGQTPVTVLGIKLGV